MKPEAQRIAIAEACPSVAFVRGNVPYWKNQYEYTESAMRPSRAEFDPLEDLNAMHEAEKVLTEDQWGPYCVILNKLACRIQCENTHTCGYTIAATAAQRAEAFLRTIWKWEDAQ